MVEKQISIYAPMVCEPSHFYLAKHGLVSKVRWDRNMPDKINLESIESYFLKGNFDFFVLVVWDRYFTNLQENLLKNSQIFGLEKAFEYYENKIYLLKRK